MEDCGYRLLRIKNCKQCSYCVIERTPGAGCAVDFICKIAGKTIKSYVEWGSQEPQDGDFPEWCPLEV